jgi:hypothetical protein
MGILERSDVRRVISNAMEVAADRAADEVMALLAGAVALRDEVHRWEAQFAALTTYVRHDPECVSAGTEPSFDAPCSCGLRGLLDRNAAAQAAAQRITGQNRRGLREALIEELYGLGASGETKVRIEEAVAAIESRWSVETRHDALRDQPEQGES